MCSGQAATEEVRVNGGDCASTHCRYSERSALWSGLRVLMPMALGHTLFEFERPVLIQNSRNKGRVYLVHRYHYRGPIPASLVVPSFGDACQVLPLPSRLPLTPR